MKRHIITALVVALSAGSAFAQEKNPAKNPEKNDVKPLLRLEAGGPTSNVTALAFSPDGNTLYAAGYDKVVRGWAWNAAKKTFELDEKIAFRVPIGPGLDGAINAIAISDDGQWLAVGGFGVVGEGMKFTEAGRLIPTKGGLTAAMRLDRGQITVFNIPERTVKTLRGHTGPVLALAFAHNSKGVPRIVSAAEGWSPTTAKATGEAKVWDVLTEKEMATREMPALSFARRPGLELIGGNELRAFLAWEDGTLTRWIIPTNNAVTLPALKYNASLDANKAFTTLLMTGMDGAKGALQGIDLDGKVIATSTLPRPQAADEFDLPLVARIVNDSSMAVVVRRLKGGVPVADSLVIVDGRTDVFGRPKATISLGEGNRILPTLAVSRDHIAIGGFPDHRILVFNVEDAGAGKANPLVLRSAGATMRTVAFAKNGADRGLALSEKADAAGGDLVFDLDAGKLRSGAAGWASDSAVAGDYRLAVNGLTVALLKANQQLSTTTVKEGAITATAILPPAGVDVPLVAIASYITTKGTTLLEVANGTTGQVLRRFAGHTAPIRSLSFRADGKLLASTADDQTTIVWSLTDLGEVLGQHGSLGDLAAEMKAKDLVVLDAAGVVGVKDGDVVRGIYNKAGKLLPLAKAGEFYEALWLKKPGQNVKLRISRGGQEIDVEAPVRQGVDVRKPLFTLFFPRDAAGKLGDWLGWNAIGPYDSSRRDVEQYLGWHFNTGRPEQPTSFAFIDQYRKEYFRPGLLKEMAETGDLPAAPKPPAPKPVVLAPGVAENGVLLTAVGGEYVVRKKAVELHLTIPAYEPFPGDQFTWQIDNGPINPLEPADVNLWAAKADIPPGPDATRRVTIRMKRTPEGWPAQEMRNDFVLRLVSPPPAISLETPKNAETVKVEKAEFPFAIKIEPGEAGVGFKAKLTQELLGRVVDSREAKSNVADAKLDGKLTLQPGLNVIQVRAVNSRAVGRPNEDEEASQTTFKVLYEPRKIPPPTFEFTKFAPEAGEAQPVAGSQLRYQGAKSGAALGYTFKSEEPVTKLEWAVGDGARQALDPAAKDRIINLRLTPGPQTVRVFLKTEKFPEIAVEQTIDFRPPPLAQPVIANLEEGFTVTGEGNQATTPLDVRFAAPEIDFKLPVTVEANVFAEGKSIGQQKVVVDAAAGSASFAKLPLAPGNNEIQVRLVNAFGGEDRVASIHGRFIRPPKIAALKHAPVGKTPFADLSAEVVSPLAPLAPLVNVTVNGQAVRPSSIDIKKGALENTWIVEAKQVPLLAVKGKDAKSDITLSLATPDGEAKAALKEAIVFNLPLPPIPAVTLVEPALRDATVSEPVTKLHFKVRSEAPLSRVDLLRGDKLLKRWDEIPAAADSVHDFSIPEIALEWGLNSLRVLAWNEGGVQTVPLNINVPPQPVQLNLDHVEVAPTGLKIRPGADGSFTPLPVGRAVLHGSVRWNSFDDASLQKAKQVRLFVNGFQHLPVDLKEVKGKSRERKFEVPVVLNFANNDVEIELPDLKQESANRRRLSIACQQPVRGQHLHVLVIAPQEKDEAKLVANLSRGIKAQPIGQNVYKTPVFDVVRFYVLAKHVQLLEISSRLDRIAESLRERARAGNPNDLVMIYFQGKETIGSEGPILWTSETAPWLQLTLKDLSKSYLSRFSGGQVLILDTVSQAGEIDFRDVRYAFLRRPDPRPLQDATRNRFSAELEKEMPRVVWLDQLTSLLAVQAQPTFQSYLPEPLKNKIQLNPN